jgi:hypothetical protein
VGTPRRSRVKYLASITKKMGRGTMLSTSGTGQRSGQTPRAIRIPSYIRFPTKVALAQY